MHNSGIGGWLVFSITRFIFKKYFSLHEWIINGELDNDRFLSCYFDDHQRWKWWWDASFLVGLLENKESEHKVLGRETHTRTCIQTHIAANLRSWGPIVLTQCAVGVVSGKSGSSSVHSNKSCWNEVMLWLLICSDWMCMNRGNQGKIVKLHLELIKLPVDVIK